MVDYMHELSEDCAPSAPLVLLTLSPLSLPPSLPVVFVGATAYADAFFGQGSGPIYFDDFLCLGTESNLLNCTHGGLNLIDGCRGHLDDAGVRCAQGKGACYDLTMHIMTCSE